MRNYITILILLIASLNSSHAMTTDHYYLKIQLTESEYVSYPPKTKFVVENRNGETILNPAQLKKQRSYVIQNPIVLYVFTSWKDTPDVYTLKSGTLSMEKTTFDYTEPKKVVIDDHFSRPSDADQKKRMTSNNVYLIKKRFFDYDTKTGYDASFEFSNGVIFYFKDGKASAWKDGEALTVKNTYLIKTNNGTLKISYRPQTKEMWWVFEKEK